ncbi:hypothetical protein BASA81_007122 [Batrachochytrium salamandrivorans]|nr:hypothetical protein BASA81_007122 [Batrachochytrium salamandrivorans]
MEIAISTNTGFTPSKQVFAERAVTAPSPLFHNELNLPTPKSSKPISHSITATTATTMTTPNKPASVSTLAELEHENKLLRSALGRMKQLVDYCQEGNRNSNALLEGAYNYCKQKKASETRNTPQRRLFNSFPLTVKVLGHFRLGDHYEYQIEVRFGESGGGHLISKRFSEFLLLRSAAIELVGPVTTPTTTTTSGQIPKHVNHHVLHLLQSSPFPKRTWFVCRDEPTLASRTRQLHEFLQHAVDAGRRAGRGSPVRELISDWLGVSFGDQDLVWCDERIRPLLDHDLRTKATRNSDAFQVLLEDHQTSLRGVTFLLDDGELDEEREN